MRYRQALPSRLPPFTIDIWANDGNTNALPSFFIKRYIYFFLKTI